jgi:hypothetical protein
VGGFDFAEGKSGATGGLRHLRRASLLAAACSAVNIRAGKGDTTMTDKLVNEILKAWAMTNDGQKSR